MIPETAVEAADYLKGFLAGLRAPVPGRKERRSAERGRNAHWVDGESWGVFRKDDGSRVRPDVTFRSEDRAQAFIDVFVNGCSEFEARKLDG